MQQPAPEQQLQTPTGLTEVKTHGVLLFRQTQITASSADCSRDEQTHVNYRLNFAIHLSKARNISKTALIPLTNPLSGRQSNARDQDVQEKKNSKLFLSFFLVATLPLK